VNRQLALVLRVAFSIRNFDTLLNDVGRIRDIILRSLNGLRREGSFSYECDYESDWNPGGCRTADYAWTGIPYDIHICWDFFSKNPRNQALRIAHEATHKWGDTEHGSSDPILDPGGYNWLLDRTNPGGT
jgi:hypothetical protein